MKRILLICLIALSSSTLFAAGDFIVNDIHYNVTSAEGAEVLTVETTYTGTSQSNNTTYSGDIVIPATVEYEGNTYTVTSIGGYTFYNAQENITSITLPETIETIGQRAFYQCYGLTEMKLPNITSLGHSAFRGCKNLPTLTLPESLETMDAYVFYQCTALDNITIPEKIDKIGDHTFYQCTSLTTVSLPAGLTTLDTYAFNGCTSLETISIPEGITTIGTYAFDGCTKLNNVVLPEGVTSVGSYAFRNCSSLTSIVIPNKVSKIDSSTFQNCTALTTVSLGNRIGSLGTNAFNGCTALSSLTSKNPTVPTVSNTNTFTNVPTSTCVLYVPTQSVDTYKADTYWSAFTNVEGTGYAVSFEVGEATDISGTIATISGKITANGNTITAAGFEYYISADDVQQVEVDSSDLSAEISAVIKGLTKNTTYTYYVYATTDEGTLYGPEATFKTTVYDFCVGGLNYNIISDDNTSIEVTFSGSNKTTATTYTGKIVIPEQITFDGVTYDVTGIGDYAFYKGSSIESIDVPNTITTIGEYAFQECDKLTDINIPNAVAEFGAHTFYKCSGLTKMPMTDNITSVGLYTYAYCTGLTEINLPGHVTTLGNYLFQYCTNVKEVTIGEGITATCTGMFQYCDALTTITFPESIVTLGSHTFSDCPSLTELTIPETVTELGQDAFKNCTGLTVMVIPENVTSMGQELFYGCSGLTDVTLPVNTEMLKSNFFRSCTSLEKIDLSKNVNLTTFDTYVFYGCSALKEVILPEGFTTIGNNDFQNCTALEEMHIPATVTSIGTNAFNGCSNLVRFYSYNVAPPTVTNANTFTKINDECVLCVPAEGKETYASTTIWKDFYDIVALNEPILATAEATDVTSRTATLNGTISVIEVTDEIKKSGFEYWEEDSSDKTTIEIEGTGEISASLTGLNRSTTYIYRLFAETADATYYGKDMTFRTWDCDFSVDDIYYNYADEEQTCVVTYGTIEYNSYTGEVNIPETTVYNDQEYVVVGIGDSAFRECTDLSTVYLPETITSIGIWAFYNCEGLTDIVIPDSVTTIGNQAFNGCTSLTKVTIGCSVNSIGTNSLNCEKLEEIYTLNPTPPTCTANAFGSVNKSTCILYVADRSYEAYISADQWKDFYTIVEMTEFAVETYEATQVAETSATLNGYAAEYYLEPGTITSKGFVYWSSDPNVVEVIIISDEDVEMSYTLSSLTPETTYTYRAFAITDSDTTYGEDVEFTTLEDTTTGINGISIESENVEGIYSTSGQKLNTTVKGVNIIRFSDGSVKKIYVK